MSASKKAPLYLATGLALIPPTVAAQQGEDECRELEGTPPGLYITVDQSQVYIVQGDKIIELDPGEAAYASESDLACLKIPPRLLDWPCGTAEAVSRPRAGTYLAETLPLLDPVSEVVRRYFEDKEVLEPSVEWLNGEMHGMFDGGEVSRLSTTDYWYLPGGDDPFASPKRPKSQLIALFWSTRQALLDGHTIERLRQISEDGEIPVVFVFQADNEVPVSFFGRDVSLKELIDAYFNRGIKVAQVPVWYAGDHHLKVAVSEFERLFEIPGLDAIDPDQRKLLAADLDANGFSVKPVAVSVLEDNGTWTLDQPERIRVAQSLGITRIPTVIFYYSGTSHLARCGVSLPQVSPVSSAAEAAPLPTELPELPAPERKASDS